MFHKQKQKQRWQRTYINNIFKNNSGNNGSLILNVINNFELLNEKNEYMPKKLFRFFAPTPQNILDLQNQRLWLSNPSSFNDPFDCNIGYNSENYEKKIILDYIKKNGCVDDNNKSKGFTCKDLDRIKNSKTTKIKHYFREEEFYQVMWEIFKDKEDEFEKAVNTEIYSRLRDIDNKVERIKEPNIRISCFSQFGKIGEFDEQILMWSHYADNHRGFCVEYNLEFLKDITQPIYRDMDFYNENKEKYLNEKILFSIKAGLFPIVYSSQRISIPVSKLINLHKCENDAEMKKIITNELIFKACIFKSSKWSYEKEWRLIIDDNICEYYNYKIPFPYSKNIYIGCKASEELIHSIIEIGSKLNLNIFIMKKAGRNFSLIPHPPFDYQKKQLERKWKNPFWQHY